MDPESRLDNIVASQSYLGLEGNVEEIKTVDGGIYHKVTDPDGNATMYEVKAPYTVYPDTFLTGEPDRHFWRTGPMTASTAGWSFTNDYATLKDYWEKWEKEEYKDVDVYRIQSRTSGEHIVACSNEKDLSVENVLKTLSAVKGKLMLDIAPIHIQRIECSMTPIVRKNIVTASKKLKMYGKRRPIIARFDEYGNRLPDEIDLGTDNGITLKIVEPKENGEFYFELKGIEFSSDYIYTNGWNQSIYKS